MGRPARSPKNGMRDLSAPLGPGASPKMSTETGPLAGNRAGTRVPRMRSFGDADLLLCFTVTIGSQPPSCVYNDSHRDARAGPPARALVSRGTYPRDSGHESRGRKRSTSRSLGRIAVQEGAAPARGA